MYAYVLDSGTVFVGVSVLDGGPLYTKNKHILVYNTQQVHISLQKWRIMGLETNIVNYMPYISLT